MSTMTLDFTSVQPRRTSQWKQIKASFAEWRRRAQSRRELATLSAMDLRDIGISPCDASREMLKPFWMA